MENEGKSGFIAVMGRPNVGKSTLLNRILGQPIAAVSPKPQTTRLQQLGILTLPGAQLVFIDTPGLHQPKHKLGEFMNQDAIEAMDEVDLIIHILDGSVPPQSEDTLVGDAYQTLKNKPPVFLVLNKIDKIPSGELDSRLVEFESLMPDAPLIPVSAATGENLDLLLEKITDILPEGPFYYPEDQITDIYERDIAADLIRANAMELLDKELPHVIAVRIDEYKIREDESAYIEATIFGERESQKGILIGQGGSMIKKIGSAARKAIESMSGRKVYLQLRVKIRKNWRNDPNSLRLFGFKGKVS
jgi:GTP-binding protein Era